MSTHEIVMRRGSPQEIPIVQEEACECGEWPDEDEPTKSHAAHVRGATITEAHAGIWKEANEFAEPDTFGNGITTALRVIERMLPG